jgi:hypothetical protein
MTTSPSARGQVPEGWITTDMRERAAEYIAQLDSMKNLQGVE